MIYHDQLYGRQNISEPVILEIIKGTSMQRLKGVDQAGYFEPYYPGSAHSRFEHSVGVYLLLRRFGAPLLEQVSGLIHDISHTAFSHCIDYMSGLRAGKHQSKQDDIHDNFVRCSEIPALLKKYNLDINYILDDSHFPLKETPLPDICADRLDYSLRDGWHYQILSKKEIGYFLKSLTVIKNRWVFKNQTSAQKYADAFRRLNQDCWSSHKSGAMLKTTGDCLKYALKKKYITKADLYTTDQHILDKINRHLTEDCQLQELVDRMNNKYGYHLDSRNYDTHIFCKSRLVNPLCLVRGQVKRLSEINPLWNKIIKKESSPKEHFIKFGQTQR